MLVDGIRGEVVKTESLDNSIERLGYVVALAIEPYAPLFAKPSYKIKINEVKHGETKT